MALTPMMQQYFDIKEQYSDCIVFFRLGDFYEMFFEDATTASRELEITLTGRDCGLEERAPMCGVPFHSAENYIARLIQKGFKVAICEQVEDADAAKGLVRRDVVRVVTPGTLIESSMLEEKKNNYLMTIFKEKHIGLAVVDVSTGELFAAEICYGNLLNKLIDEIVRFAPSEVIVNSSLYAHPNFFETVSKRLGIYLTQLEENHFKEEDAINRLRDHFQGHAVELPADARLNALGGLLFYLQRTSKVDLKHITKLNTYEVESFMNLDAATRRNLEITETIMERSKKGSILSILDKTMTSMGGRMLRKWLEQPLLNVSDIRDRLTAVSFFKEKFMLRSELREHLKRVYDMERLIGKIVMGTANGRDLIALKQSIGRIPEIKALLFECTDALNTSLNRQIDSLSDVWELIEKSIEEEPPVTVKEGGVIKTGYHPEVDELREATTQGKNWVLAVEMREREQTGIKNLKVGFNKVFGYFLEVTKSYFHLVPAHFIRRQTLSNCERYITPELKEIEEKILGAQERSIELEYQLFMEVRAALISEAHRMKETAEALSRIDAITALAEVADRENYCMPEMDTGNVIQITDGRHPVVEAFIGRETFVPNDTMLDLGENRISILTGPNMAGKSTYMRQVAIIVLLAQMGSFVPAASARIGVVDRIFTRVGAQDDLASGKSTFMVEMSEVAHILENATKRSLVILDEIGRGTSTYDGLSIAWSVVEYIARPDKLGARTLFATHYHELTELEQKLPGVKNYCIAVKEKGEDILFLRKIIRGGADGSYGIQVARLAGLPGNVLDRAREILKELENADIVRLQSKMKKSLQPIDGQVDIFCLNKPASKESQIIEDLEGLDLSALTPIDALNVLYEMQKQLKK